MSRLSVVVGYQSPRMSRMYSIVGYALSFFVILYFFASAFVFSNADSEPRAALLIFIVELITMTVASFYLALKPPYFASMQARYIFHTLYFLIIAANLILILDGGSCYNGFCVPEF